MQREVQGRHQMLFGSWCFDFAGYGLLLWAARFWLAFAAKRAAWSG
jgi:hypothetical protein